MNAKLKALLEIIDQGPQGNETTPEFLASVMELTQDIQDDDPTGSINQPIKLRRSALRSAEIQRVGRRLGPDVRRQYEAEHRQYVQKQQELNDAIIAGVFAIGAVAAAGAAGGAPLGAVALAQLPKLAEAIKPLAGAGEGA